MCLALPVRVVELADDEQAVVDLGGIRKQVSIALVDDVRVGDYVILHVGYALTKLDPDEAEKTLALFREAGIGVPDSSPFKGEAGRGMGSEAGYGDPSPPLPRPGERLQALAASAGPQAAGPAVLSASRPLEGEGKWSDARRDCA